MPIVRQTPDPTKFNHEASLPYMLRLEDFGLVMQDVYDFFFDVNTHLSERGLKRFDEMLRPAAMSGLLSDMITASMARHSRVLVENRYHNGHPDLIVNGIYPNDAVKAGEEGVEVKSTRNSGGGRRHPRCPRAVDVCVRLQGRQRNGTRRRTRSHEIHRGLSRPRHRRRFSKKPPERTWNAYRYPP